LKDDNVTIQIISEQINVIKTKWKNVVSSRPGEDAGVKNFFGQDASYASISSQIDRWLEHITRLSAKPRVSQSLPKNLVLSTARCLSSVSRSLDSIGNGVEWIFLSGGFGQSFLLADYLINELVKDSSREQVQILDEAKNRLSSDLKSMQDGAAIAKNLGESWPNVEKQLEQLESSSESFTEILKNLSKIVDEAKISVERQTDEVAESISKESNKVVGAKAEFDKAIISTQDGFQDAEKLKSNAENLLADITQKSLSAAKGLADASAALEKATAQQNATHERLTLALRDAQMEGLAGSFTRMADNTEASITRAQRRFDIALVYLMIVGVLALWFEINYGFAKSAEEFSFRLVRMLSLATPGIWIAWIASRKVSALNRVFTDYQYKSASALAYESYRQTVTDAGDDQLKQQLLSFAIRSFGENPTHYYDSAKNESSSPFESLLDRVPFLGKTKSEPSKTPLL
jgi:hypothetical protein